jgi:hypothetical protein
MVAGRANVNRKGTKNMTQDAMGSVRTVERLWMREAGRLLRHSRELVEKVLSAQGDGADPELVQLQHDIVEMENVVDRNGGAL